jgi:pyruvate dehydrogenase (quinone)
MSRSLEIAIREAVGRRGVSVIVLPGVVVLQHATAAPAPASLDLLPAEPVVLPPAASVRALADLLNGASRVTVLCGVGCAGAHDQLLALGEKLKSPMVHALKGKEHVEWG